MPGVPVADVQHPVVVGGEREPVGSGQLVGDEPDLAVAADREDARRTASSLAGSSKAAGSPNGGSVKNSVPSARQTRSLGEFSRRPS